ncbi:MAG: hypothetical protein JJ956_08680 [Pseudomonadales bacterium]|nr:hypothetical protein [Pseudomonadales bacterium]
MVKYRDGQLYDDYEKQVEKFEALESSLDLLNVQVADALSTDLTIAKAGILLDAFVVAAKTSADAVSAVVPGAMIAKSVATDGTNFWLNEFRTGMVLGNDWHNLMSKASYFEAAKFAMKYSGNAFAGYLAGMADAIQTLVEGAERNNEWKQLIQHLENNRSQLVKLQSEIQKGINKAQNSFREKNQVKEFIDEYCATPRSKSGNVISLRDIENVLLVSTGSSSQAGSALKFDGEYVDMCEWSEVKTQTGGFEKPDNYTPISHQVYTRLDGSAERQGKFDTKKKELFFRPGAYGFSGKRYSYSFTNKGIALSSGGQSRGEYVLPENMNFNAATKCGR